MKNNFDDLEDIFGETNGTEKIIEPTYKPEDFDDITNQSDFSDVPKKENTSQYLNKELVNYYMERPGLLEGDIESGIIPKDVAKDLRNAIYAYPEIEQNNPPLVDENNTSSKGKVKVKSTKAGKLLHESYDLGFAETLLLGLVVSSIGLVYLGYLYLVI